MKKTTWIALVVSAFAALAVVMVFKNARPAADRQITAEEMSPIPSPAWELADVNGKTVKSTDFSGKVVILDFWATWCGPCRMEIPGFIELQQQYADQGLVVVGVSLDQDGVAAVKPFMDKEGINYPIVMGDEAMVSAFGGVEAIPTTFIIDRAGQIVRKHVGYTDKAEFEAEIKPLLKM